MAVTCAELGKSRIGAEQGIEGYQNYSRLALVQLDDLVQDPILALRDGAYSATGLRIRQGDVHPYTKYVNAQRHILVDHMANNPLKCVVMVVYGDPRFGVSTGLWDISIQSSLASEHVLRDLDGVTIGPPAFRPQGSSASSASVQYTDLEGKSQSLSDPTGGADWSTFESSLASIGQRITIQRRAEGAERMTGHSRVRLQSNIGSFPAGGVRMATQAIANPYINSDQIFVSCTCGNIQLADPKTVMFSDFTLETHEGFLFGQRTPGVYCSVEIGLDVFGLNVYPYQRAWTYTPDTGGEAPVLRNGLNVIEAFRLYNTTNFNNILTQFVPQSGGR